RRLGVVEAAACEGEVGSPPQRAGEAPAIAGAAEEVARLRETPLRALVVAGCRVDRPEPGDRETHSSAVALGAPQLQRLLEGGASREQRSPRELEVGAPGEHRRPADLVAG